MTLRIDRFGSKKKLSRRNARVWSLVTRLSSGRFEASDQIRSPLDVTWSFDEEASHAVGDEHHVVQAGVVARGIERGLGLADLRPGQATRTAGTSPRSDTGRPRSGSGRGNRGVRSSAMIMSVKMNGSSSRPWTRSTGILPGWCGSSIRMSALSSTVDGRAKPARANGPRLAEI